MRVVCDNCGASYKIPDSKLTKEVNKATCRKCGHAIFIRRAGEEEQRTVASQPTAHNEERTLITSAADLERAVRARASSFDESADQRPTTVSVESGHSEATVPREPAPPSSFAPAPAFPPPPQTAPPAPRATPTISPVADAPPAFARPAEPARSSAAAPPPPIASPRPATPPAGAADTLPAGAHDPRTDLSMALVALFVSVLGVLVLSVSAVLQSPIVAGLGAFLSLLGTFVVAFILLSGGRGTKPANLLVSFAGGFFFSGALGGALGAVLFVMVPTEPDPRGAVAAATPEAPVAPPPPAVDLAAEAAAKAATALAAETAAAEAAAAEAAALAAAQPEPVAPPPAAPVTPPPAAASSSGSSSGSSSKQTASRSSTSTGSSSADAPVRIQPSSSSSGSSSSGSSGSGSTSTASAPKSTSSSTSSRSSGSSSSSTKSSSSNTSGVSPVVIDTMIKSNKSVKTCFVQQRNETGDLPHGVKIKLTIQSSGKVSSAGIPSGEWKSSSFDDCLSGAVQSISFPPFDGDSVTVTYPFAI